LLKVGVRKVLVFLSKTIIVKDLSKITGSEFLEAQKTSRKLFKCKPVKPASSHFKFIIPRSVHVLKTGPLYLHVQKIPVVVAWSR